MSASVLISAVRRSLTAPNMSVKGKEAVSLSATLTPDRTVMGSNEINLFRPKKKMSASAV